MVVGTPDVDANGVKYYPVTSVYQGSQQQIVRVLQPTNPTPGKPLRILYVLPVDQGVTTVDSTWSDGLEELRMLDVQDRFNMILIAPSFNYTPWYGDNVTDSALRMESFIIDDLVPWGDTFLHGATTQRYLIGFSKSGNGVLFLMLRHPAVFNAGAAWDSPAQQSSLSADPTLATNFGTQANYNNYFIPSLVTTNSQPFTQENRLWISGDQAAWTADMDELNDQLNAVSIPHTWVAGPERAHSWNSGWLNGAVTDLDANNPTAIAPVGGSIAPARTGGMPGSTLPSGTTQTTLSLKTDLKATCRYSTTAGVAYASMANTFSTTGSTSQATTVSGLQSGVNYTFNVRCQDTASGIVDTTDYAISFSVAPAPSGATVSSSFSGVEDPLSENGMWGATGSWSTLKKNNGAYSTDTGAARLVTPAVFADQFAEITYDQNPGSSAWPGVMTRIQGANSGSGYLAIAYNGAVELFRVDDGGSVGFTWLAEANASVGTSPRRLRLESQGSTHRVYFNGTLLVTYNDTANSYTSGQPGIAAAIFGGPTIKILTFTGGALTSGPDTTPPVRSAGAPTGALATGTTQATLSLTTNEVATCRYSTTAGIAYSAMTKAFTSAGGVAQSAAVTGLKNGTTYNYYVRCQDTAGNANPDDYPITFSVNAADTTPPVRSAGAPAGTLASGTTQTALSLITNEAATCRYSTTAGVAYSAMTKTFGGAGGTSQSTTITGLVSGTTYSYYVRCQDTAGNANTDDYPISFSVAKVVDTTPPVRSAGAPTGTLASGTTQITLSLTTNEAATCRYSTAAGVAFASMTKTFSGAGGTAQSTTVTGLVNGTSYNYYVRCQDTSGNANTDDYLITFSVANVADTTPPVRSAGAPTGTLASGTTQATLSLTTNEAATCRYSTTAGVAYASMTKTFTAAGGTAQTATVTGLVNGTTYKYDVRCQDTAGNANPDDYLITFSVASPTDTTPPVRSAGAPTGTLASGITQATLSLTTSETATCRYSTTAGVAYASMTKTFTAAGGTAQSTAVTGLVNATTYSYYVRCQDTAGNANPDDYLITFSVAAASGGTTASSSFTGIENPLSENGMWGATGSWSTLLKNNGAYTTALTSGARLVTPVVSADQFSQITFDQDPGASAWPAVMTRVQGATNGSGYLAIAYNSEVILYRTDDNGGLNFTWLAAADASLGTAPRTLRLESQGSTHRVYFNGTLLITYTDTTYTTGQPGIAAAIFGGPTVHILTFTGGSL
jgi:hypothetical protein